MSSKITEAEWAAAKPDIKYLYLTLHKSLKEVKEEMNQRNFQATESQYRTQFKKWGQKWAKNRKTEEMEMLSVLIEGRKLNGKESNVFEWGKLLKKEEVKKRTARSNPNTLRRLELENKQLLPRQFVVRTPTEDRTSLFTLDLPFFQLEKSICNGTLVSGILSNTGVNARLLTDQITVPENPLAIRQRSIEYAFKHIKLLDKPWRDPFLNTETAILNALSSIIPCHIHQTTVLGPPLYRQLLHSAGNNFAGLGSFPATQILQILNETTSVDLYALVLSPLGHSSLYSARSMAQSLLESAIHAGHSTTVKAILSSKSLAIDVNQQFILGYRRYTLIEMASLLGHDCIIKILLYHDADVDKTYPCEDCTAGIPNLFGCTSHGALQCLLGYGSSKKHGETVQMLLNATSYVNMKTLALLIRRGYGDIASGVTVEYSLGCREDVIPHLREVFELQEESTLAGMLHLLHSRGIDVTHNDIFVAAVMKKSWKLVEVLLSYGLVLNKALLHYLFESRLGFGQSSLDRIKPCFPILPRFPSLPVEVEMVQEEPGSSRCIFTNRIPPAELDALCVKWMAAVDEVDTKLIEELTSELRNLNIPIVTFRFFYHALMEVSRMGDYETASILLCRIANLDLPIGHRVFQDALSEAIRGGNNNLVQLVLAFNAHLYDVIRDYHLITATAYLLQPYTELEFLYPPDTILRSHIVKSRLSRPRIVK
ncbi:hypothetical protein K445DRAFT_23599 [Daldinia sp. EC12]|nr:hypothetical protein K445DRAFT_23599 [Daldinia sp. EC12]